MDAYTHWLWYHFGLECPGTVDQWYGNDAMLALQFARWRRARSATLLEGLFPTLNLVAAAETGNAVENAEHLSQAFGD